MQEVNSKSGYACLHMNFTTSLRLGCDKRKKI